VPFITAILMEPRMKLSARNQLKGKIVDITKGATTSHVRVDLGHGVIVTARGRSGPAKRRRRLGGDQGFRRDDRQVAGVVIRSYPKRS
jgi:hypothetical protein